MMTFTEAGQIAKEEVLKMAAESEGPQKAFYHLVAVVSVPIAEWIGTYGVTLSKRDLFEVFNNYAAHLMAETLQNVCEPGQVIDIKIVAEEYRSALEDKLSGPFENIARADLQINRA